MQIVANHLDRCPSCGGPTARALTLRASGLGPGDVVTVCAEAQMAPNLPASEMYACGAVLPHASLGGAA